MDVLKKGMTEQTPVGQKQPRKTDEATQRPMQQDTKASGGDKPGKFTVRK